jgi:F420-0:gamma-glutamyl ligase-like protein
MDFSPADKADIKRMAAELVVEEIRREAGGDLLSMIVIPSGAAAHLVGLSTKQLPLRLPVTAIAAGKHGVTARAIMDHIRKNTTQPLAAVRNTKTA